MDVFLDMTGTITDMESENLAMLKLAELIGKRFSLDMRPEDILRRIEEYRRPMMKRRDVEYIPIRFLILEAVKNIVPKNLCANDSYWILDQYSIVHAKYVKLAPGVREGLERIRNIADHLGIITDGDRPYTEKLLESLGIANLFDSITTAEDAGVGKPNPKIFELALKNSRTEPRMYVGDSEKRDVEGAKKVGMITIKIGSESEKADYVVANLLEAARVIESLHRA